MKINALKKWIGRHLGVPGEDRGRKLKAGAFDYVPRFLILHGYAGFINILDLHLHMDQIFPMWTLVSMFCGVTDFSPLGAVPRSVCIGAAAKISESFGGIIYPLRD